MPRVPLEITNCIVCDDVRREITGKDIIIGVYSGDIIVGTLPFVLNLALWIECRIISKNPFGLRIRVTFGEEKTAEVGIEFEANNPGQASIVTPPLPVKGKAAGELKVETSINNGEWKLLKTKAVREGTTVSLAGISSPPLGGG